MAIGLYCIIEAFSTININYNISHPYVLIKELSSNVFLYSRLFFWYQIITHHPHQRLGLLTSLTQYQLTTMEQHCLYHKSIEYTYQRNVSKRHWEGQASTIIEPVSVYPSEGNRRIQMFPSRSSFRTDQETGRVQNAMFHQISNSFFSL